MLPTIVRYELPKLLAASVRYDLDPQTWGEFFLNCFLIAVLIFLILFIITLIAAIISIISNSEYVRNRAERKLIAQRVYEDNYKGFKQNDWVYRTTKKYNPTWRAWYNVEEHVKIKYWIYTKSKNISAIIFSDDHTFDIQDIVYMKPGKKIKNHLPLWF